MNRILGLHHITAIASEARRNYEFYSNVLGLRLVKKTVNFDDPKTYHLYYGDEAGHAGTILTFFPWPGMYKGRNGAGMATGIGYSVPSQSLPYWKQRFGQLHVNCGAIRERFGIPCLSFEDPDGLKFDLIANDNDSRKAWETDDISATAAIRGFNDVTLMVKDVRPTATVLTDLLGYELKAQEGSRYRFATQSVSTANIIDVVESPAEGKGIGAAGTNHHVAFRVKDDTVLMEFRERVLNKGLDITPKINRDYFFSLYFREPGGVLFELATENPGFTTDEPLHELGANLMLPRRYEPARKEIEEHLPEL